MKNASILLFLSLITMWGMGTAQAQSQIIPDDRFAGGGVSWLTKASPGVTVNKSVEELDGEPALCVEMVDEPDENAASDLRIYQYFGVIEPDRDYVLSFQAKAERPAKIVGFINPEDKEGKVLWREEIKISEEWSDYKFRIKAKDYADNAVIGFARLGLVQNKYWFRRFVVAEE